MLRGVAYSSLARRLFPLNSEFMTFLAKEGLHQVKMRFNGCVLFLIKNVIFAFSVFTGTPEATGIFLSKIGRNC